ncbi:putative sugar O-methyltransferase [Candidatus Margulisiibacteriota bacterium]
MKLYIPKGGKMTDQEKNDWIMNVNKMTEEFNKNELPVKYPIDIKSYSVLKKKTKYKEFITEMWQEHYDKAEKLCMQGKKDLLRDNLLMYAFNLFAGGLWQKSQIPYLESRWDEERLKQYLLEDAFMGPFITSDKYHSSEQKINHLTHLTLFEEKTKADIDKMNMIVELGGGYGGMCRLLRKFNDKATHIIIDLPIFLIIHQYYLNNIVGKENVNLITDSSQGIKEGKVNLIDVSDDESIRLILESTPDLFIAAWSLSEANKHTQDYIYSKEYFNAKHLLIGYRHYEEINKRQPCSDSIRLTKQYKSIFNGSAFYALAKEQWYNFAKKRS